MRILVTGSRGLIGQALVRFLAAGGHDITRLVRSRPPSREAQVFWDPEAGTADIAALEGFDAVVHLAGENIAGRWTAKKKARIYDSRVKGTRLLSESLVQLTKPPKVLVSVSAVGYYGDCGDQIVREDHPPGPGFLAQVCRDWEAAAEPAVRSGIRVVNPRMGVVLSVAGGVFPWMLRPFRIGLGGPVGSGRQYMSWVTIDDLMEIILVAITHESLKGPVNAVAPNPVTNLEFTRTLGRILRRPTVFPLPAFVAHLALGEMADELLLASACVEPAYLLSTGYQFRFPRLEGALRHLLGKE